MARLLRLMGAVLLVSCLSAGAVAHDLSTPDPDGAGFSAARLARIAPWYQWQIGSGALPGAVVAIAREGKLAHLQAIGTYDRAGKRPLKPDAIFWIASMTKPVTSVAAMMLVEEGKLDLNAPISRYLPEFKDMPVGIDRVAAKRPPQIIDLLRHTAGLVYPDDASSEVHKLYGRKVVFRRDHSLADFVASFAGLPLAHQPGEVWEYSWGVDVLGRVVEVVSGQPLDQFLETRIFKPLGMRDTSFQVPASKLDRLVDPIEGGRPPIWDLTKPTKLFAGGAGLASTAPDYLRFCQMLLNGGELDGARLLSSQTVRRMASDSLTSDVTFAGSIGQFVGPRVGTTWGLGFAVRAHRDYSLLPGAVGSFNWSGLWGTYFWIDPAEKLIAVQMIQVPPDRAFLYRDALRHLTYAALTVPRSPAGAAPPSAPGSPNTPLRYVGVYDFGRSLSAHDRNEPIPALAFAGTGIEVAMVEGKIAVRGVRLSAPADKAGVLAADVILEVDGMPLAGFSVSQAVEKLRGPAGTTVRVKVARQGEAQPIEYNIERDIIRPLGAQVEVRFVDGVLQVSAVGPWSVLDIEKGKFVTLKPAGGETFRVEGSDDTILAFLSERPGSATGLVLNPGPAQIKAVRIK